MTLQEFQDELHAEYQGDDDTPSSSDAEWTTRLRFLKGAIREWAGEEGITWSELWKLLSDNTAGDGDKTVVAATLEYDCPADFDFPGGFVRTTDANGQHTYWEVMTQERSELFKNESVQACYFTGNQSDGYVLHFMQQPTAGDTIEYPYYKTPTIPSGASDVIEMSDPLFAIHWCLFKMHKIDGEGDQAITEFRLAQSCMKKMRTKNILPVFLQENKVPDRDLDLGTGGFGE